jgi:hypothetical protein
MKIELKQDSTLLGTFCRIGVSAAIQAKQYCLTAPFQKLRSLPSAGKLDVTKIVPPIYKQNFSFITQQCPVMKRLSLLVPV